MGNFKLFGGSAALITLLSSTASFADVTAGEVWSNWQDYMTGFGYEVAASETETSDGVSVTGLTIAMDLPDDGGKVNVNFGAMDFNNLGDGTVAIVMPEHKPVSITVNNDFSVTVNYDTAGMNIIVSGSAEEMAYVYSAPEIKISIADLLIEGDKIDEAKLDMVLTNVAGKSNSVLGALRHMTQSYGVDMLTYDFALAEPGGSFAMTVKGSMSDFTGNFDSMVPQNVDFTKMAEALNSGFAAKGGLNWGAGGYEFTSTDRGNSVTGNSTSNDGNLNFAMNRESINYGGTANGTKASFTSSDLPFPVDITIAQSVFDLLMPVNKSDTPSDFGMTVKLGDFTVSDGIWSMIDPGAVLSRDPATILLDFVGKANWAVDIMDPEKAAEMDIDMPGQLHALTLKSLQIKAAGADLTGTGDFTFNNDDLETFDGLPAPTGALDLKLVGGNGLMDNLVKMGLLPEDQAMGARMMMGLFAVVGEGEDTLTSKIEVTGDGHILANGQRLK